MRVFVEGPTLGHMTTNGGGIEVLVLQEFRLSHADTDGTVARIVKRSVPGLEPPVPLLTSIEDRRNVAVIRALHSDESRTPDAAQYAALDPFVARWSAPTEYSPRISERSVSPPSRYRLAVTESGINGADADAVAAPSRSDAESAHLGLLWVGEPIGTHAGLLVLLGDDAESSVATPPAPDWPLSLSKFLGVRIYEGG